MTANDIFKIGAALIAESVGEDPDMVKFSPSYLNIILQECLNAENSVRLSDGMETLAAAPFISGEGDMNNEIAYNDHLTRVAIPYALASNYYRENGDNYHEMQLRAEYISAVNDSMRYNFELIKDVYA